MMMLRHLGLHGKAALIENALLSTLESGVRTGDFGSPEVKASSTLEFAQAIISHLGATPRNHPLHGTDGEYTPPTGHAPVNTIMESAPVPQSVVGVDLFVESNHQPRDLAHVIEGVLVGHEKLTLISNRGTQVWPSGSVLTDCVNQYRVRIEVGGESVASEREMLGIALRVSEKVRVCSTEVLMNYKGVAAYTLAQGQ
jgi:isocitrate dehydrogenase